MTEEWICEKLRQLKVKETSLSTLTEIRYHLNEIPDLDVEVTNRLLTAPELYECLEGDEIDGKLLDAACAILTRCLDNLSFEGNSGLHHLLHRALEHKQITIKALILNNLLKELYELMTRVEVNPTSIISVELLEYILLAVQEEETEVSRPASRILSIVLKHYLDEPTVKDTLLKALKKSDVVKCRLYELAVKIGLDSAACLGKIEYILDHALSELDNDDVLVQANVLEILVPLSESNPGLLYLEKRQVLDVLSKRVEDMEHNHLNQLLIPGIMKFFGKIASVQPQKIINGYPHMVRCLLECFHSGDNSMLPTALDTLVNLTYTEHGVYLLEKDYPNAMKNAFEKSSAFLKNLPIELKIRVLDSLNYIFTFEKQVLPEVSSILQRWFLNLTGGSANMQFLMRSCHVPFGDLRYATLNLIRAVCNYSWGVEALKNTAGLLEFLLDRTIQIDNPAKYVKFIIVSQLANSEAFDPQTNILLRTYINEGPYYVQSDVEIDVEGN